MPKYIVLTDIPAPYRISLYNEMYKNGLDFEVFYMRTTVPERSWKFDPSAMAHPHYIDRGFYRMLGRFHVHFNPRLIWKLVRARGADIIMAANWNDPDVLVLAALARLGIMKARFHWWSEANHLTIGASRDNIFKRVLRKFVYNAAAGTQLTSGKMTEITFDKWGMPGKTFIPLMNTIEEEKFVVSPADVDARERNPIPVFIMPVRLLENVKGIVNFLRSIGDDNIRRAKFMIAGDGPDQAMIEEFIRARGVQQHVQLLGFRDTAEMERLYRQASLFVLPSFSDPNPLSVIEALKMELPLLISDRCGNHFEALVDGDNGYIFDPLRPASVRESFEKLMARRGDWRRMGERGRDIYHAVFARRLVIENFVSALRDVTREPV